MAPGTSGDQIIEIPDSWFSKIMEGQDPPSRPKPLIQKVDPTLREIESNKACFDPLVVSFGPYHHGCDHLKQMEDYQKVAARKFFSPTGNSPLVSINKVEAEKIYKNFVAEVGKGPPPKDCYADDKFGDKKDKTYSEDEWMHMMFLDSCFILHFIRLALKRNGDMSKKSSHLNGPLILRDMFLLENQIPYTILKALMCLMPEKNQPNCPDRKSNGGNEIDRFIHMVFLYIDESAGSGNIASFLEEMCSGKRKTKGSNGGGLISRSAVKDQEPLHLLDYLRSELIGKPRATSTFPEDKNGNVPYYFRSIMELKAAGIKLRRSNSKKLRDINFEKGLIHAHLSLPQLVVDDGTKSRLLNLIAYEMCPDGLLDRTVTSYVCFLDSLIDRAEDVKELRSKKILLNRLGSDEEVAKLFNELANYLTPEESTYSNVMQAIEHHWKNKVRVWIAEFMHTHFSSPWTVMALVVATSVLILTLFQTIYTAGGYYKQFHEKH